MSYTTPNNTYNPGPGIGSSSNGNGSSGNGNRAMARPGQGRLQVVPPSTSGAELPIPYSVEAEEAVLGSLLADRDTVSIVAPVLKPQHFFGGARATVYEVILELYAEGTPADLVTVKNELKALEALGEGDDQVQPSYLLKLLRGTPSPVHVGHYAEIVIKHWLARQLIAECCQTVAQAHVGEGLLQPGELLAQHAGRLQSLSASLSSLQPTYYLSHEKSQDYPLKVETAEERAHQAQNDPWQASEEGQGASRASQRQRPIAPRLGWEAFDGRDWAEPPLLCLLPATLTTILARTGGGKTIAAMQIADANALAGLNVLYFHVELNQEQMLARRYCRLTGVPVLDQLLGRVSDRQRELLVKASGEVSKWPGRVDFVHCPNWNAEKLVSEIKARHYALMASKGQGRGYDLIVLDYLQRLGRPDGRQSEHEALAYNVRAYSDCANELNVAALMTSQVGRSSGSGSEARQYEPPELDEGLGSGDIERCSNQLLSLAINGDKTSVKWAIRKNTFGEGGRGGELLYDPRRLQFM